MATKQKSPQTNTGMASAKQSATSEQKENTSNQNNNSSLLEKFFIDQLKDIYYAEQQLTKALVEMKEATSTEELEDAFDTHAKQTERHVKRLEKVFQSLEKEPEGKKCEAIEGLIREAKTIINETQSGTMTRDAALIIAAQKIEHYEIATYGGLLQLALTMEREKAADLLEKTLREEEETDLLLTDVAESFINIEAEEEKKYSWNQTA